MEKTTKQREEKKRKQDVQKTKDFRQKKSLRYKAVKSITMSNAALQVYGGDEVSAVVIDPGSYTTNIGYSGSDFPQSILPSVYGKYTADEGNKKYF